ncbi:methyltransferase domain-containing protein [Planomonospora sp. ID67723]|uniref:class I SAM-dependent methyltransferase n=1 Tax=Planomonospora sp. ID67723 TaxID=2738134 RepID=UPI0018C3D9BE|nr:methyltransferase domain-containing protein [Planomonospora sp. ID67723]MBG0829248.1 methyltransferase domain-containing protein [Planomonospora sp. ID67723]
MMGELYADSLAGAATEIEYVDGTRRALEAARWLEPIEGDESVLARCAGPTLDVGSGPGRLTVALARRGVPALGIDITPHAVHLTRRAGGFALLRDVFGDVPGSGAWATVLLADGNIGIGGDPSALLRRVRELVRPGGEAVVEAEPPGTRSRVDRVRLRRGGTVGGWFGWATVSAADLVRLALDSGFGTADCWWEAGRWFAALR